MQNGTVTLSANSGLSLKMGQATILVDALHEKKESVFSPLSPRLQQQLETHPAFSQPDILFFTHLHPDHYSRRLAMRWRSLWPAAQLILPEQEFADQLLLTETQHELSCRDLTLRFIRLPHEGPQFKSVPLYGLLIKRGNFTVLLVGDCELATPVLGEQLQGERIDVMIAPFTWASLSRGQEAVRRVVRPHSLLLCHLPFPEDDHMHYYEAAKRYSQHLTEVPDIRFLTAPLQQECF